MKLSHGVLLAATVGAMSGAWVPARADETSQAKKACKEIAQDRDWDDAKANVQKEGENRIVVTMTGEQGNDDRERRCVYSVDSGEAKFTKD